MGVLMYEQNYLQVKELGQLYGCYQVILLSIQQAVKKMQIGKVVQRVTLGLIQVK
jgi:hypothetical protein